MLQLVLNQYTKACEWNPGLLGETAIWMFYQIYVPLRLI